MQYNKVCKYINQIAKFLVKECLIHIETHLFKHKIEIAYQRARSLTKLNK